MPKKVQGFNEDGESEWFEGDRLPEGWSIKDPRGNDEPKKDDDSDADSSEAA